MSTIGYTSRSFTLPHGAFMTLAEWRVAERQAWEHAWEGLCAALRARRECDWKAPPATWGRSWFDYERRADFAAAAFELLECRRRAAERD